MFCSLLLHHFSSSRLTMMSRTKSGLLILASISVSEALSASITPANKPAKPDKPRNKDNSKPNFVYILSDDQ